MCQRCVMLDCSQRILLTHSVACESLRINVMMIGCRIRQHHIARLDELTSARVITLASVHTLVRAFRYRDSSETKAKQLQGFHQLMVIIYDMTRTHKNGRDVVQLSTRDWLAAMALILPISIFIISGYLRHDRMLTQVIVQQQSLSERMIRVESTLDGRGGS